MQAALGWHLALVLGGAIGIVVAVAWSSVPGRVAGIAHEHVGTAVGPMLTIAAVGGFVVPLGFGAVADRAGSGPAWVFLAAVTFAFALIGLAGRRQGPRPGAGSRPSPGLSRAPPMTCSSAPHAVIGG